MTVKHDQFFRRSVNWYDTATTHTATEMNFCISRDRTPTRGSRHRNRHPRHMRTIGPRFGHVTRGERPVSLAIAQEGAILRHARPSGALRAEADDPT